MSWSPASSDNDSSTSSGDDNEPLTIQDIEKWHSRTTAMNTHSSFNTDTSTLENTVGEDEEQNTITKGASGETTEGSVGSSAAGSADGDYHASFDTNHADDNNRPSRHVVAGLAWTDNDGYEGMYTGEVNEDNVPDGLGLIRYGEVGGGEQEGEWRDGTLIRKKGVASTNVIQLSTIEEENVKASGTTSASSMKYTEEFANFLAAKQIGIEGDTLRSSSNSMDANTTGENSNARDFADSTSTRQSNLYSSTSSRQSHLYYERRNSRSSLYSSTNSRHLNSSTNSRQDYHRYNKQPSGITKRKTGESTTHEGSDSESDHNSISSGDNFRDSQQHHHEDLELVAEENEEEEGEEEEVAPESSRKSSSGRSNSEIMDDENIERDQRPSEKKVPYEAIDAIQKLMANDSNVEYDSDESSNGEHEEDDSSALFDWHEKDTHKHMRASTNSFFPGVVDDSDDDEMGPSMGAHFDGQESEDTEERRSCCFYCPSLKRSRRWWYIFSACCILFITAIALVSWGITRMRTNNTPNDTNTNVPNAQSKEDDSAGAKISLSWETDAACAPVTIDLVTDQYGNETTWVLYRLSEVNKDTKMSKATRASETETEVGHRKLLRPVTSPESNRKMEETPNNGSQVIKSGGPYTYLSDTEGNSTSSVYSSSVCLPEGNYNLVISDGNGFCCKYGLGHYSVYFDGGRTVRDAPGLFMGEDMTPFEVTSDDVLAALATANPSQSLGPSAYISTMATSSPMVAPEDSLVPPSTQPTVVFKNSSVSLNLAPQSRQPTPSSTVSPQPTLSKPTETTSQPSILSLPMTASPTLSQTVAPSTVPSDPPMSASLSPTPRITNITTTEPTLQTNPPSASSTPLPSVLPSSSPSEVLDSIPPTTSGNPTATSSPSTNPTNFNPLLDIELLDSLSIPYKLSHMLSGESHTVTTSRRLQAKSADSLYGFSTAVSADMSVLAVGATNALDDYGNHTGAVYLYTMDTSVAESIPTLVQVLYGLIPEGEFGNDVKLSDDGSRLVVAARSENEQEGAIRIYDRYPGSDEWYVIRTIVGAGAGFRAGWSVDISGDGNVVAMGSTKGSLNEGGMVITYVSPDWTLHGSIIEAQTPRDVMGFSVALNGDGSVVAVGSVKASNPDRVTNAGRAEVHAFNGTSWISQFEVFGETKQAYVGSSVALSRDGNLFVVGGRGFTNDGENAPAVGRCRIFERAESGAYELLSEIVGTNSREELGWSASISADGNKVACGGKGGKMLDWGETGVARVWDRSSLVESELLPRGSGERFSSVKGASFGSSVSLSSDGSSLVVGASTWSGTAEAASASGAVQLFGIGAQSSISPVVSPTPVSVSSAPTTEVVSPPTTGNQLSIVPSASAPPSAPPTIFDPILDIELLDSLSSPYSKTRFTEGKSADSLYGFSTAVSADMSVLAVGATNAIDDYGNHTGAVYLYSVDTSVSESIPTLVQVLYGSNPESEFGNDVKLSDDGNRLVVAARSENEQEGAIRIYNRPPRSELWELSHTIVGAGAGFRAGWSVDISGDGSVVAMGSTKAGSNANEGGIVSTYIAPDWTLHGSIIEAQTPRDVMGFSVALNGDGTVVAVGSVKASNPDRVANAGRAEVHAFNGTSWISQFEVFGETKQAYVGSSVALSRDGNLFVVGGRGFTNDGENAPAVGRCRIFERAESGAYELLSEIVGTNSREELGWSASISADGNKVACGGKGGKMLDWGETGVARVWDRSSLVESELLPRGSGERFSSFKGASFGSSVSLSSDGSSLVVGASTLAGTNITSPGGVYSFSLS